MPNDNLDMFKVMTILDSAVPRADDDSYLSVDARSRLSPAILRRFPLLAWVDILFWSTAMRAGGLDDKLRICRRVFDTALVCCTDLGNLDHIEGVANGILALMGRLSERLLIGGRAAASRMSYEIWTHIILHDSTSTSILLVLLSFCIS